MNIAYCLAVVALDIGELSVSSNAEAPGEDADWKQHMQNKNSILNTVTADKLDIKNAMYVK